MRWVLALALVTACGGGGGSGDGGADDTVDADLLVDAEPGCGVTWTRVATPVTDLTLIDPVALNGDRSFRVAVTVTLGPCYERAMPVVTVDAGAKMVDIDTFAWRPLGADCTDDEQSVDRPVTLKLGEGTWTLHAGNEMLMVTVNSPPDRACNPVIACAMDCDCQGGQVCLGGYGLAGEFTQCAFPCELDRDCGGTGTCVTVADGLASYCEGTEECGTGQPCPAGYDCVSGACQPQTQLGQSSRIECDCDADCAAPLRCVESDVPGRGRRCEIACPTAGPWCTGPHYCGPADEDLAELAPADGVCVFAGE